MVLPSDPNMLLSFMNLKLRDYYSSLDALCEDLNMDKSLIEGKLSEIDYHYDATQNKFI